MTGEALGAAGDREVRAECQRALPEGVARVLSTATRVPPAWAASASRRTSQTSSPGLDGVSIQSSLAPSITASWASPAVGAVRTWTPYASSWARTSGRAWYPSSGRTTVSPARAWESRTAETAAMPEAKTTVSTSSPGASSSPMARSSRVQVGLVSRP